MGFLFGEPKNQIKEIYKQVDRAKQKALLEAKEVFEGLDERDSALMIAANIGIIRCPARLSTRLESYSLILDGLDYMLAQEGISAIDEMLGAERTLLKQAWWSEFVDDWKEKWLIHDEKDIGFWGYLHKKLQPYIYDFGYYYQTPADYKDKGPFKGPIKQVSWRVDIKSNSVTPTIQPVSNQLEKGLVLASRGRNGEAIIEFNRYIKMKPNDPMAYVLRGDSYDDMGQFEEAIEDYSKSIELEPTLAWAYDRRGTAYSQLGDSEKAIKDLNKAIELYPENAKYYFNRSVMYDKSGNIDKTIDDCTKAIELDKNFAKAYYNRGIGYNEKGEYDKAIFDFNKTISLEPDFMSDVYFNRGIAYQGIGETIKALADYKRVLELISDPEDIEIVNKKISELTRGGEIERIGSGEQDPWLVAFMPLYEQAAPLIQTVVKLDAGGLPADLTTLVEANERLRPILESARKLPKPKQKEFRNIKKDFENVLSRCIRAGETGVKLLDDLGHGAPQMAVRMRFATIVGYTGQASIYYESLLKRLTSLSEK